jgi:uncharacterized membrane protein (DUF485 family)
VKTALIYLDESDTMDENSIITSIFYKKDAYTDQLRISKTIVISLIFFVLMFFFILLIAISDPESLLIQSIGISLFFAAICTAPVFLIGWVISYIMDNNARKSKMMMAHQQPVNNVPPVQQQPNTNVGSYNQSTTNSVSQVPETPVAPSPVGTIDERFAAPEVQGSSDLVDSQASSVGGESDNPNVILDNVSHNMQGLQAIEYLYSLDISNWNDNQKALYYYIMGINCKKEPSIASTDLPNAFFAAQVYHNPNENVLGWKELGVTPSEENARMLHEKYPIPGTYDEFVNWKQDEEPVEETTPEVDDSQTVELTDSQVNDYIVKIANSSPPLSLDDEDYECKEEYDALKNQGDSVVSRIEYYLKGFAANRASFLGCDTWYYGGKYLVKLLGDINTENSLNVVAGLFLVQSNIAEWYWNILNEAAVVLGDTGDKKYLDVLNNALNHNMAPVTQISQAIEKISGEKSQDPKAILNDAEIKINYNDGEVLETIEYLYSIDTSNWDDEELQYYYYVLARACEKEEKLKDTDLPKAFYSAQVFTFPKNTCLGWHVLGESPSEENARRLHEMYPIPETFDDLKRIRDNADKEEIPEVVPDEEPVKAETEEIIEEEIPEVVPDEVEDNVEEEIPEVVPDEEPVKAETEEIIEEEIPEVVPDEVVDDVEETQATAEDSQSTSDEDTDYSASFKKYL